MVTVDGQAFVLVYPGLEDFLGRNEEDALLRLGSRVAHFQLFNQEIDRPQQMLLLHL